MTPARPTIAELSRSGIVAAGEIVAAVTAYVHDIFKKEHFRFASGHVLDVAAAVQAHPPSAAAMREPTARENTRRLAVSTAIMLSRPARAS